MLTDLKTIVTEAQKGGYAVGSFNTPNLESINGVIGAAEALNVPVILMHAEVHEELAPLDMIGEVMIARAKSAKVPVAVHLDHGVSFEYIIKAMKMGFTSVMYDGSTLPYAENLRNTQEIVRIAHAMGVSVEAELGRVLRNETGSDKPEENEQYTPDMYTDPEKAAEFVAQTGIDALAIAFGTAHGIYDTAPILDFERIKMVRKLVTVPLVMHGGSGISEEGFHTAINNGISKVNYYTYMAKAGAEGIKHYLKFINNVFFHDIAIKATEVMKEDAQRAIKVFMNGKA